MSRWGNLVRDKEGRSSNRSPRAGRRLGAGLALAGALLTTTAGAPARTDGGGSPEQTRALRAGKTSAATTRLPATRLIDTNTKKL